MNLRSTGNLALILGALGLNRSASMPINKFLYFGDFAAIPVAIAVLAYLALSARGLAGTPDLASVRMPGREPWVVCGQSSLTPGS